MVQYPKRACRRLVTAAVEHDLATSCTEIVQMLYTICRFILFFISKRFDPQTARYRCTDITGGWTVSCRGLEWRWRHAACVITQKH